MTRHILQWAIALSLPLVSLQAQDATPPTAKMAGNWDFSFTGPQGAMTWRVNFTQAGDTLTGQAQSDFGTLPVSEGWVTGNELSFGLTLSFEGQSIVVYFSGLVKGDSAEGSIEVPNAGIPVIPFIAARVVESSGSPMDRARRIEH
ncbi:MAG TPA: hypothetical protein VF981_01640 [Gemmatimonadaceae bacterium]